MWRCKLLASVAALVMTYVFVFPRLETTTVAMGAAQAQESAEETELLETVLPAEDDVEQTKEWIRHLITDQAMPQ